jgi:ribosomal subunit interface protein
MKIRSDELKGCVFPTYRERNAHSIQEEKIMEVTLQITMRDIPHSDALESHIREKAAKLEKFYPHIMHCRVTVELPHRHHHQGRLFDVRIDMTVPGGELVINRIVNEDVHIAVRDAFDAAKRQLENYSHRQASSLPDKSA